MTSIQKANALSGECDARAASMIASLEKKPAVPIVVNGMPKPVSASVPTIIVQ